MLKINLIKIPQKSKLKNPTIESKQNDSKQIHKSKRSERSCSNKDKLEVDESEDEEEESESESVEDCECRGIDNKIPKRVRFAPDAKSCDSTKRGTKRYVKSI